MNKMAGPTSKDKLPGTEELSGKDELSGKEELSGKDELSGLLRSITRPLRLATKDSFRRAGVVRGLPELAKATFQRAGVLKAGPGLLKAFKELSALFEGFDSLGLEGKKKALAAALEVLRELGDGTFVPISGKSTPGESTPGESTPGESISGKSIPAGSDLPTCTPTSESDLTKTPTDVRTSLKALSTPLRYVKGIGPKLSERLKKKGLSTIEDFLYYLPYRYEDRSSLKSIRELTPGESGLTTGEVVVAGETRYGRRRVFEAVITDGSGILKLKWFNFRLKYMTRYKPGVRLTVFGPVTAYGAQKEIIHPDVEFDAPTDDKVDNKVDDKGDDKGPGKTGEGAGKDDASSVMPVYSHIDNMHQKTIRKLVWSVVSEFAASAVSALPPGVARRQGLMDLADAFREVHKPGSIAGVKALVAPASERARRSLVFDELFTLEVGLLLKRNGLRRERGIAFSGSDGLEKKLRKLLPFKLTPAQERVIAEIKSDMALPHPMNRLIQGDVGSGKTLVALSAVLSAVGSGYQAAIMAPTEILAEQHYLTIHGYVEALGLRCVLLTGSLKAREKKEVLTLIEDGTAEIVIGTHALIQKGVDFKRLGLAVIDEQHRFGVLQRAELMKKAAGAGSVGSLPPDIIVMTATPIPRTLSMTVFGDMDVSIIDELPKGRQPVSTTLLRESEKLKAYARVRDELASGAQAYVVYPLVEESEELSLKDATNMKKELEEGPFRDFRVGLLHGRMKGEEKETVMAAFKAHEIDVLVATTVIEVGVDVPNAAVMLIEHAERFGLSQLHQLRGRVGRGTRKSQCIMLAAFTQNEDTWQRLKVFTSTTDGFKIAEEDLKFRGPGDFTGTRQSGLPEFRSGDAFGDPGLIKLARDEAGGFLKKDPDLTSPEGRVIKEILKARWKDRLELAEVG